MTTATLREQPPQIETLPPLTIEESRRLRECERVIERGLQTFYEVGNALAEIRDSRLYRLTDATFDDYCDRKWKMSRQRAYQLIGAATVIDNLSTIVDKPTNEAQARELTALDAIAQKAVWQIAVKTATKDEEGKPVVTAGHIKSVVDVLSDVVRTGGLDDGSGEMKPLGVLIDAAVTEETYERLQRQKEYIKERADAKAEEDAEHERKARFKSDRSEVEVVYEAQVQSNLVRYLLTATEFEEMDWPGELEYFRRMFQLHKAHANFQKTRNVADDCEMILTVVKRFPQFDTEFGFTMAAQELYDWVFDLGYCMSKKEFTARLKHMNRDDVRMLMLTDAGDGKQEDRRGALPGIVCLPWRKVHVRDRICSDCGEPNDRKQTEEYATICSKCFKDYSRA